jgi:hypothetical protein
MYNLSQRPVCATNNRLTAIPRTASLEEIAMQQAFLIGRWRSSVNRIIHHPVLAQTINAATLYGSQRRIIHRAARCWLVLVNKWVVSGLFRLPQVTIDTRLVETGSGPTDPNYSPRGPNTR